MKGTNKKKATKKAKAKGGGGKIAKRAHLHSGNNQWNNWMRSHRPPTGLDGTPQGHHDTKQKETCRCGGCINKLLEAQNGSP